MITLTFITPDGDRHLAETSTGLTVMQAATSRGIPGIDAECGGSLACATCHVYIEPEWHERLPGAGEQEQQMLEFAESKVEVTSRLSCQIRLNDKLDGLIVRIPPAQ